MQVIRKIGRISILIVIAVLSLVCGPAYSQEALTSDEQQLIMERVGILCPLADAAGRAKIIAIAEQTFTGDRVPDWQWSDVIMRIDRLYSRTAEHWQAAAGQDNSCRAEMDAARTAFDAADLKTATEKIDAALDKTAAAGGPAYLRGSIAEMMADYDKADSMYRQADKLATEKSDTANAVKYQTALGELLLFQEKYEQAEKVLVPALETARKNLPEGNELARVIFALGSVYDCSDRVHQACELITEALAMKEKHLDENDPALVEYMEKAAECYIRLDYLVKSEELIDRAMPLAQEKLGKLHPLIAKMIECRVVFRMFDCDYEEAEVMLQDAVAILNKSMGHDNPLTTDGMISRCIVLWCVGKEYAPEVEKIVKECLELDIKAHGEKHFTCSRDLIVFGSYYYHLKKYDLAEDYFNRASKIEKNTPDPDDIDEGWCLLTLGLIYENTCRYELVEKTLKAALQSYKNKFGMENVQISSVIVTLINYYSTNDQNTYVEENYNLILQYYSVFHQKNNKPYYAARRDIERYQEFLRNNGINEKAISERIKKLYPEYFGAEQL